jgi:hypothetical protein
MLFSPHENANRSRQSTIVGFDVSIVNAEKSPSATAILAPSEADGLNSVVASSPHRPVVAAGHFR